MPTCSVYLDDETLDAIKEMSEKQEISLSRIVRDALSQYLGQTVRPRARERVLERMRTLRPLGTPADWEGAHRERTNSDEDRR